MLTGLLVSVTPSLGHYAKQGLFEFLATLTLRISMRDDTTAARRCIFIYPPSPFTMAINIMPMPLRPSKA